MSFRVAIMLGCVSLSADAKAQPPAVPAPPRTEAPAVPSPPPSTAGIPAFADIIQSRPVLAETPVGSSTFAVGIAGPYAVAAHEPPVTAEVSPFAAGTVQPGWYAAVTLGFARPHLDGATSAGNQFGQLDWTVMPRVEVGYRLGDLTGDFRLGYRLLTDSGTEQSPLESRRSRITVNSVDLDYISREWLAEAGSDIARDLRVVAGIRIASARLTESADVAGHFRSDFAGTGPRFGLEWNASLPHSPFELYARADATGLVVQSRQKLTVLGSEVSGPLQANGVAVFGAEIGLGWRPNGTDGFRVLLGYQFEQWWNFARSDSANADLTINGVFLRGEWRY